MFYEVNESRREPKPVMEIRKSGKMFTPHLPSQKPDRYRIASLSVPTLLVSFHPISL